MGTDMGETPRAGGVRREVLPRVSCGGPIEDRRGDPKEDERQPLHPTASPAPHMHLHKGGAPPRRPPKETLVI